MTEVCKFWWRCSLIKKSLRGKIYCTCTHPKCFQLSLPDSYHLRVFPEWLHQLSSLAIFYLAVRRWRSLWHLQAVRFALYFFFDILHLGVIKMGCFLPAGHCPLLGGTLMLLFQSQVSRVPISAVPWKCLLWGVRVRVSRFSVKF